jgi:hypothetical protein
MTAVFPLAAAALTTAAFFEKLARSQCYCCEQPTAERAVISPNKELMSTQQL